MLPRLSLSTFVLCGALTSAHLSAAEDPRDFSGPHRILRAARRAGHAPADPAVTSMPIDDAVLEVALTFTDAALYRRPQVVTVYYQHLDDAALPAPTCAAELWRQALDAANP